MFRNIFIREHAGGFRSRSSERDDATDKATIGKVAEAIDDALSALQAEQVGLSRRVEESIALASVAVGTDSDEYMTREPAKTASLRNHEQEMKRGRERLSKLEEHIANLRFLRAAFLTRFPDANAKRP